MDISRWHINVLIYAWQAHYQLEILNKFKILGGSVIMKIIRCETEVNKMWGTFHETVKGAVVIEPRDD